MGASSRSWRNPRARAAASARSGLGRPATPQWASQRTAPSMLSRARSRAPAPPQSSELGPGPQPSVCRARPAWQASSPVSGCAWQA